MTPLFSAKPEQNYAPALHHFPLVISGSFLLDGCARRSRVRKLSPGTQTRERARDSLSEIEKSSRDSVGL
jgi:hypothetical protein